MNAPLKHRRKPAYRFRDGTRPPRPPKSNDFAGWQKERKLSDPMPADPMLPFPYDDMDLSAANALKAGRASSLQQQRIAAWVVQVARTYDETFHPNEKISAYIQGMRRVGREFVKLMNSRTSGQSNSEQG